MDKLIFYFTGTGNSGYIADEIAKGTNDSIISISKIINNKESLEFTLKDNENIGFIFPVYAWAPPIMVTEFIKKVKFNNFKDNYIFSVATCGENIGGTMRIIKKNLKEKDMKLNCGYSIVMPNNYIISGDVDSKEDEEKKLEAAKIRINEIITAIENKEDNILKVTKGLIGPILTTLVSPTFIKYAADTSKFYIEDSCIGCGLCEKVCNCDTIKLVDKKPVWGEDCIQCLACIHICPKRAIQYGEGTVKKGRYNNPYFKVVN